MEKVSLDIQVREKKGIATKCNVFEPAKTRRTLDFYANQENVKQSEEESSAAATAENYGFGSFQDIFFTTSEPQKVAEFQYELLHPYEVRKSDIIQWISKKKDTFRYPHVALRCNGLIHPGGLGEILFLSSYCIWIQGQLSLTDISNTTSTRSSCAVIQLPFSDMTQIESMRFQKKIDAIELKLRATPDVVLQFVFMPGPYQKHEYADQVIRCLRKQLETQQQQEEEEEHSDEDADVFHEEEEGEGEGEGEEEEEEEEEEEASPDELQQLVAAYLNAPAHSPESYAIAASVFTLYNYFIGPMSSEQPLFTSSLEYRKEIVQKLNVMITEMKENKAIEVVLREKHTGLTIETGPDGNNVYVEIGTRNAVAAKEYERRYVAFVQEHEKNDRCADTDGLPTESFDAGMGRSSSAEQAVAAVAPPCQAVVTTSSMTGSPTERESTQTVESTSERRSTPTKLASSSSSSSSSSSVQPTTCEGQTTPSTLLLEPDQDDRNVDLPVYLETESQRRRANQLKDVYVNHVDELEQTLWTAWDAAMQTYHTQIEELKARLFRDFEALRAHEGDDASTRRRPHGENHSSVGEKGGKAKRSKLRRNSRRMSIVNPIEVDMEEYEASLCAAAAGPTGGPMTTTAREDGSTNVEDAATPSEEALAAIRRRQRRARRKSLVAPSDLAALDHALLNSEPSGLNAADEEDDDIFVASDKSDTTCPVCHDKTVSMVLRPCEHKICQSCFLKWFENGECCPYDRQPVVSFAQI